jgi:GTPase SAR1 family protein
VDCVCFVYGINSKFLFEKISFWLEDAKKVIKNPKLKMVLIGNKCDLEEEREISKEEGQKLAQELQMYFFEMFGKHLFIGTLYV